MFTLPPAFTQHLEAQSRAARTVDGDAHDLALFAQWFEQQTHEPLTPATRTPTDVRHYRLNTDARRVLKAWCDLSAITTGRVFRGQRGTPFSISGRNRMLDEYGLRAKVEVSPHTLRHTVAKNLVDAGVPLDQVATLLGHEKLETTRLYTLPGARGLEKAVARLAGSDPKSRTQHPSGFVIQYTS